MPGCNNIRAISPISYSFRSGNPVCTDAHRNRRIPRCPEICPVDFHGIGKTVNIRKTILVNEIEVGQVILFLFL